MWSCIGPYTGMPEWSGSHTNSFWGGYKQKFSNMNNSIWRCEFNDPNASPWSDSIAESLYMTTVSGWNPKRWQQPRFFLNIPRPSIKIHVSHTNDWHLSSAHRVGQDMKFAIDRHKTGTPILFADGHTRFFTAQYIIQNTTDLADDTSIDNFNLQ